MRIINRDDPANEAERLDRQEVFENSGNIWSESPVASLFSVLSAVTSEPNPDYDAKRGSAIGWDKLAEPGMRRTFGIFSLAH